MIDNLNYMAITTVLTTFMLGASAIKDVRRREIPIWLCIAIACISGILHCVFHTGWTEYLIAAIFFLIVYFLQAILVTGSGGDLILMTSLGFITGITCSLVTVAVSGVFILYYVLISKKKRGEEFPLAPFILCGYFVYLILFCCGWLDTFQLYVNHLFN